MEEKDNSEVEDSSSALDVELESLKSIYINETDIQKENQCIIVTIDLHPATADNLHEQYVKMTLKLILNENYPEKLPEIHIRNPRGLSDEKLNSITENLMKIAESKLGNSMIFEIVEAAKDHLTAENRPCEECAICLHGFHDEDVFTKTECYHYFHSHCLARYSKYFFSTKDDGSGETLEKPDLLCPVCRLVIQFEESEVEFPPPKKGDEQFEANQAFLDLQEKMKALYMQQVEKGGIIDLEAEKNKYLIEISNVPTITNTVSSEMDDDEKDSKVEEKEDIASTSNENKTTQVNSENISCEEDNNYMKNHQYKHRPGRGGRYNNAGGSKFNRQNRNFDQDWHDNYRNNRPDNRRNFPQYNNYRKNARYGGDRNDGYYDSGRSNERYDRRNDNNDRRAYRGGGARNESRNPNYKRNNYSNNRIDKNYDEKNEIKNDRKAAMSNDENLIEKDFNQDDKVGEEQSETGALSGNERKDHFDDESKFDEEKAYEAEDGEPNLEEDSFGDKKSGRHNNAPLDSQGDRKFNRNERHHDGRNYGWYEKPNFRRDDRRDNRFDHRVQHNRQDNRRNDRFENRRENRFDGRNFGQGNGRHMYNEHDNRQFRDRRDNRQYGYERRNYDDRRNHYGKGNRSEYDNDRKSEVACDDCENLSVSPKFEQEEVKTHDTVNESTPVKNDSKKMLSSEQQGDDEENIHSKNKFLSRNSGAHRTDNFRKQNSAYSTNNSNGKKFNSHKYSNYRPQANYSKPHNLESESQNIDDSNSTVDKKSFSSFRSLNNSSPSNIEGDIEASCSQPTGYNSRSDLASAERELQSTGLSGNNEYPRGNDGYRQGGRHPRDDSTRNYNRGRNSQNDYTNNSRTSNPNRKYHLKKQISSDRQNSVENDNGGESKIDSKSKEFTSDKSVKDSSSVTSNEKNPRCADEESVPSSNFLPPMSSSVAPPPGFQNPSRKIVYGLAAANPPPGFNRS